MTDPDAFDISDRVERTGFKDPWLETKISRPRALALLRKTRHTINQTQDDQSSSHLGTPGKT
jgi:hypothetical protein